MTVPPSVYARNQAACHTCVDDKRCRCLQAAVSALPVAQPFTMGTSSPTQEPLLHDGTATRRMSSARLGPPLAQRRTSDENADTCSVSEFEWDIGSRADMSVVSKGASSRSRRSSVSVSEHAFPQVSPCLNRASFSSSCQGGRTASSPASAWAEELSSMLI